VQAGRGAAADDPWARIRESARAVMEAEFRACRMDAGDVGGIVDHVFNTHQRVRVVV
jgi:hypothetical protein